MSEKQKFEMNLTKEQTSTFLRRLADAIENNEEYIQDYEMNLNNYHKLKLSVRPKTEQMALKVSLKKHFEGNEDEEYEEMKGKEKYKKLKKRMESYFNEISDSISNDHFPSKEIVSVFLKDSETMCTYKGEGDEYYQEYRKACSKLQDAYDKEEMNSLRNTFDQVVEIKNRCHSKYE